MVRKNINLSSWRVRFRAFSLADEPRAPCCVHQVTCHNPDLVFLEAVVNDGDSILETGDEIGVRRAVEGGPGNLRCRYYCHFIVLDVVQTSWKNVYKGRRY